MTKSFILTIQNDLEDEKMHIIFEGVRNVFLVSFEAMEEMDHF